MTIRVLIVDDSVLMRRALASLLTSDPEIEVVGQARDGQAAIEMVASLRPDVITMDVRMPVLDGLQTTEHIMAYYPTPILVVTSSLSRFDIDITFKMLGLGALDVMEKPSSNDPNGLQHARAELIRRVKMLSRVRVVTHLRGRRRLGTGSSLSSSGTGMLRKRRGTRPINGTDTLRRLRESHALQPTDALRRTRGAQLLGQAPAAPAAPITHPVPHRAPSPRTLPGVAERLIVIGASTGGPRVLQQILSDLPPDVPAAILIVQHIAEGFTRGMVDWLSATCRLPIHLAAQGDVAVPGHVFVAPDTKHLLIDEQGVITLSSQPAILQCPSIDVTMQRAADAYGHRTIGVLLTGMGRDGAIGMAAIKRSGGHTIAQTGESCVVFGMPRAAIEANAAQDVLAPEAIAGQLQVLVRDQIKRERR